MAELPDILIALHGRHDGPHENRIAAMAYGAVIEIGGRRFEAWGYGRFGDTQSVKAIGFNEAVHFCIQDNIELFDDDSGQARIVCVTRGGENFSKMTDHIWKDLEAKRRPHIDRGDDWLEHLFLKIFADAIFREPMSSREQDLLARAEAMAAEKAAIARQKGGRKQGLWESSVGEVAL